MQTSWLVALRCITPKSVITRYIVPPSFRRVNLCSIGENIINPGKEHAQDRVPYIEDSRLRFARVQGPVLLPRALCITV